jgi:hypothetical protein
MTSAMTTIKAQGTKLNDAVAELAKWKVDLTVEVVPSGGGFGMKLVARKPNGQGFTKTMTPEEVLYFQNDPGTLVEQVIDDIVTYLLREQVRGEISRIITLGVRNAAKMANNHEA